MKLTNGVLMKAILILVALTCSLTVLRAQQYQAQFQNYISGTIDFTLDPVTLNLNVNSGSITGSADLGTGNFGFIDSNGNQSVSGFLDLGMGTGPDGFGNITYPVFGGAVLDQQQVTDLNNGLLLVSYNNSQGDSPINSYASISEISSSAPEPSTWALMLGGLAFLGFCIRRKAAPPK